jgi:hypothetical protein
MKCLHYIIMGLLFIITISACQKEPAIEIDAKFIGNWEHHQNANKTIYLTIEADSKGQIEYYENGSFKSDTQQRKWLIKKNTLYFGWLATKDEIFSINQYPVKASTIVINNYDTILAGENYMVLDGGYYKKSN